MILWVFAEFYPNCCTISSDCSTIGCERWQKLLHHQKNRGKRRRWVHMNTDVGICSISNGICHLFGRSTVPFEQIHLVLCCSVLVSIISCYLPVNYFITWIFDLVKMMVVKCWKKTSQTYTRENEHGYQTWCRCWFVGVGYAFLRCHVARQLSSTTIKMQLHQKHMIKTTSPNPNENKLPSTNLKKKFKTKDIPTPLSQNVLFAPSFWCGFFLVGQELESALVAQLQQDAVAFSVGVLTQNGMGWEPAWRRCFDSLVGGFVGKNFPQKKWDERNGVCFWMRSCETYDFEDNFR